MWEAATGKPLGPLSIMAIGTMGGVRVTTRGDALIDNACIDTNLGFHESLDWGRVVDISAEGRYIMQGDETVAPHGLQSLGIPLPVFERGEGATFVSMSPDGSKVFGYAGDEPSVWDIGDGKRLFP